MQISEQTRAVLLLTAWLGKVGADGPRPLTTAEWGRFAAWLHARGLTPADFLADPALLREWSDAKVPADRIAQLLERSAALAMSVERWQRAGLWIISRSDAAWPRRLRARKGMTAPPILFGAGNPDLLQAGGVAIVGARDVDDADLDFTSRLGATVARQAANVVSGGARGVDESAMLGALAVEGTALGVLADSLLRAATSSHYRKYLMDGNLVLASPFNPEAGFSVANAMARNRYVYCLADAAVVIASARDKGGTWSGATENLRHGWVPLWVKPDSAHPGNAELLRQGGMPLPGLDLLEVAALAAATSGEKKPAGLLDGLPETADAGCRGSNMGTAGPDSGTAARIAEVPVAPIPDDTTARPQGEPDTSTVNGALRDFYSLFLYRLREETSAGPLTPAELQERLRLHKTQLAEWLQQAVEEGEAEKLTRPVRYQIASARQPSLGL